MEKSFFLSLFLSLADICLATFYRQGHHIFHRQHFWRHLLISRLRPPTQAIPLGFIPPRIPPNFVQPQINPDISIKNIVPKSGLYPGIGINIPNPLHHLNTYDLPPWTESSPIFRNAERWPNVDNIIPEVPTRETTVLVTRRKLIPATSGTTNDNEDTDDDKHYTTTISSTVQDDDEEQQTTTTMMPPPIVPPVRQKPCQETGCNIGSECTYANRWICPSDKPDVPCLCKQGCRLENTFIPLGGSAIVDTCGNTCTCNNLFGMLNCTKHTCDAPIKDSMTTDLVLEPVPTDITDRGPSRGDFPLSIFSNSVNNANGKEMTFPNQNFVPPIPFLTGRNNLEQNPGNGASSVNNGKTNGPALFPSMDMIADMNRNIQTDAMEFPITGR